MEVPLLTPTLNSWQRMHWSRRAKEKKRWREELFMALLASGAKLPRRPLARCLLSVDRYSSGAVPPDWDNLIAGLKPVLDAMQELRMIADDGPMCLIEAPMMRCHRVGRRTEQRSVIALEEVVAPPAF